MDVSFKTTPQEAKLIDAIVKRAVEVHDVPKMALTMDLTACHANGCPLRLKDLLAASPFDFAQDIMGITNHIDRRTGKLMDQFLPRFSQPQP